MNQPTTGKRPPAHDVTSPASNQIDAAGCLAADSGMGQLFTRLANERHEELRIDFAGMRQLDSLTLGRLMLLRNRAHAAGTKRIVLDNVRKEMAKVFDNHDYRHLFVIS